MKTIEELVREVGSQDIIMGVQTGFICPDVVHTAKTLAACPPEPVEIGGLLPAIWFLGIAFFLAAIIDCIARLRAAGSKP